MIKAFIVHYSIIVYPGHEYHSATMVQVHPTKYCRHFGYFTHTAVTENEG